MSNVKNETEIYILSKDSFFNPYGIFPLAYLPNNRWSPNISLFAEYSRGSRLVLEYSQWNVAIYYNGYGTSADHTNYFHLEKYEISYQVPMLNTPKNKFGIYFLGGDGLNIATVETSIPDQKPLARFKRAISGNIGVGARYNYSRFISLESSIIYNAGNLKKQIFPPT